MSCLQQPPTTRVSLPVLALLVAALFSTAHAATPVLTHAQKQALVQAWHAGYHYGLTDTFAAVVFIESGGCQSLTGDHGMAFGCSQIHAHAAYVATGIKLPAWILADPALQDVNMAVGAKYLSLCITKFGWPAGIGCYNRGLHTRLTRHQLSHLRYTCAVLAAMAWIKQLPEDTQ